MGKVNIIGLSLGSALATSALARNSAKSIPYPDGSSNKLYNRAVVFPPFYGVSVPNLDRDAQECAGSKDECIAAFAKSIAGGTSDSGSSADETEASGFEEFLESTLNHFISANTIDGGYQELQSNLRYALSAIAGASDDFYSFLFSPLTSMEFGWGDQCEDDRTNLGRGGYCNFKIANLLAVHALGEWSLAAALNRELQVDDIQFIPVERDGYSRNGMVVEAAIATAQSSFINTNLCMYRVLQGCDPDEKGSECGVPHSCIAPGDNLGIKPASELACAATGSCTADDMYWWPGMKAATIEFVKNGTPFGDGTTNWDGTYDNCQNLNINQVPSSLASLPKSLLSVVLNKKVADMSDEDIQKVATSIAATIGVPSYLAEPVAKKNMKDHTNDENELFLFVTPEVCAPAVDLVKTREIAYIDGLASVYVRSATCKNHLGDVVSDTCPEGVKWSTEASVLAEYRPAPITSSNGDGDVTYLGFKDEYTAACEECGSSWTSVDGVSGIKTWNYNYAWNAGVGMRSFWEQSSKGWGQVKKWYQVRMLGAKREGKYLTLSQQYSNSFASTQSCPSGYERESWWRWSSKCVIPSSAKFLGEGCSKKSQCSNDFLSGYVDTTCAPTNNDENDPQWKCVLDEESNAVSPYASSCSCFGLIWCTSSDCGGNQCVLSTMDGKKHCKYADEPLFKWDQLVGGKGDCSNCRASDNSCQAYGSADKWGTDTSRIAFLSGAIGLGAAGVIGVSVTMKRKKMRGAGGDSLEMAGKTMV